MHVGGGFSVCVSGFVFVSVQSHGTSAALLAELSPTEPEYPLLVAGEMLNLKYCFDFEHLTQYCAPSMVFLKLSEEVE